MKATELRTKSAQELQKLRTDLQEKVRALRFKIATNQGTNHRELRATKKDLARINTLLTVEKSKEQAK